MKAAEEIMSLTMFDKRLGTFKNLSSVAEDGLL